MKKSFENCCIKTSIEICWHLIAPPSTPDILGQVGLNLVPVAVIMMEACMLLAGVSIGDPNKNH